MQQKLEAMINHCGAGAIAWISDDQGIVIESAGNQARDLAERVGAEYALLIRDLAALAEGMGLGRLQAVTFRCAGPALSCLRAPSEGLTLACLIPSPGHHGVAVGALRGAAHKLFEQTGP